MRKIIIGIAAAVALIAASAGITFAATSSSPSFILACYANKQPHVMIHRTGPKCPSGYTSLIWNVQGPRGAMGPKGATGATGPRGLPGVDGHTILHGTGAPANTVGHDGDFYLDTAHAALYGPKANGAWPPFGVVLIGPSTAGPSGLDTTIVTSTTSTSTALAVCPASQPYVLGGGFITPPGDPVTYNEPISDWVGHQDAWEVNVNTAENGIWAYAICSK